MEDEIKQEKDERRKKTKQEDGTRNKEIGNEEKWEKMFVAYLETKNEPMPQKNAILLLICPCLPRIFLLPLSNQQPKPPRRASLRAPKEACMIYALPGRKNIFKKRAA